MENLLFISLSDVLQVLPGVIAAARAPEETAALATKLMTNASSKSNNPLQTVQQWYTAVDAVSTKTGGEPPGDTELLQATQLANLALAVTFVRLKSREDIPISPDELGYIWKLIHQALTSSSTRSLFSASRSAQGFLTVPLCSLLNGKDIDQLFRLHVWLPDSNRGNPDFAVHSHQPYIQAWILAGEGTDHSFKVEPTSDPEKATHAEYTLSWKSSSSAQPDPSNDNKSSNDNSYKTHQASSTAMNTGKLVRAECTASTVHARDTSYSVPAGQHHQSEISPTAFHATLCFFDSKRGFIRDAPALGPVKDTISHTQPRDPGNSTPSSLATQVQSVRTWEDLIAQGQNHARRAELEEGLRCYNTAMATCSDSQFPIAMRYIHLFEGHIGCLYRRFGRYEAAEGWLLRSVAGLSSCSRCAEREQAKKGIYKGDGCEDGCCGNGSGNGAEFIEFTGELAVIYRHMSRLHDAKRMCELQCSAARAEMAKDKMGARRLQFERSLCRAVGNLAMVNYQLWQESQSQSNHADEKEEKGLLDLAIEQQNERVHRAQELQRLIPEKVTDSATRALWLRETITWETIGFSRLSLYHSAQGKPKESIQCAREALQRTAKSADTTVLAMSRFFLGRALLLDGQKEEALQNFNMLDADGSAASTGRCTPAMAFCKEPSVEHREYLRQLVEAGADMRLVDEHDYTALDYAVFSGDAETEALVLEGMRKNFASVQGHVADDTIRSEIDHASVVGQTLAQHLADSKLRKGYRTLFQEKLRPVLLVAGKARHPGTSSPSSSTSAFQILRKVYADTLGNDPAQRSMFDGLKFLRYEDFLRFGRLPRSSDDLARVYQHAKSEHEDSSPRVEEGERAAQVKYIIFFSYRWINKDPGAVSPDDRYHTQYKRMITASELFMMEMHPEVKANELGLWIDFACVDQDEPMKGVSALPMILAQCNAVISLTDGDYYTRAWCSVEVMVAQTLAKSYGLHLWYEHVYDGTTEKGQLKAGPLDMEIVMADKLLSFERDRPKVLFLERQSRLLG
ncbi:hypothetical protein QBC37DRAFT_128730 [Rhypophila decipiens]|uniref:Uncharacterized protein n=1 Tax=Rhypophila decipiens TaxID=261697 RepID=A0AAN6YAP0_9PEZI|nr:hypothetical protein QBC37DRAFT_128730 [Rhypophila decipiens]